MSSSTYKSQLHLTISEAAAQAGYTADELSTFWLAALEAAGDADRPFLEAGHEAVREFRNREITERHRLRTQRCPQDDGSTQISGPEYAHDQAAFRTWQLSEQDAPDAEQENEPDSAAQHEALERLIDQLPSDDQRIARDRLAEIPESETAEALGCSQPNISQRRKDVERKLQVLSRLSELPISQADLDACTPAQRTQIGKLLTGGRFVRSTVTAGAKRMSATAQEHIRVRLAARLHTRKREVIDSQE